MDHCRRRYSGGVLLDGGVVVFVPYDSERIGEPPWRQPGGKSMVSSVNSTRIGWHLCVVDLRFATGLPPGRFRKKWSGASDAGSRN